MAFAFIGNQAAGIQRRVRVLPDHLAGLFFTSGVCPKYVKHNKSSEFTVQFFVWTSHWNLNLSTFHYLLSTLYFGIASPLIDFSFHQFSMGQKLLTATTHDSLCPPSAFAIEYHQKQSAFSFMFLKSSDYKVQHTDIESWCAAFVFLRLLIKPTYHL